MNIELGLTIFDIFPSNNCHTGLDPVSREYLRYIKAWIPISTSLRQE